LNYAGPVLLGSEHVVAGFDCGKPALNEWLARRALANQVTGTSRTWAVLGGEPVRVVAFYASCTAAVVRSQAPRSLARDQPEQIPAVLLGRLAVDLEHKGRGLGAALLKHFSLKAAQVAESVGVRLLLVHAKDDEAKSFYARFGFVQSPVDPLVLMMLVPADRR
jgi:GNAT superfamily N-acetyltransferase